MAKNNFTVKLVVGGRSEITDASEFYQVLDDIFNKAYDLGADMQPVWRDAEEIVMSEIDEIFSSEGTVGFGGGWPQLNPKYHEWKKKALGGRDRGMLIFYGVMKASIGVERKTPNMLKITASDPKARYHQFGINPPGSRGDLPARPFMYLTPDAVRGIVRLVSGRIEDILNDRKTSRRSDFVKKNLKKGVIHPSKRPRGGGYTSQYAGRS